MRSPSFKLILGLCAALPACQSYEPVEDHGRVCVTAVADGDAWRVEVAADSRDCASDHEDASYTCSVDDEGGGVVRVSTVFQDGDDPNDGCGGPLLATCSASLAASGKVVLRFGDEQAELQVPGGPICLGEPEA